MKKQYSIVIGLAAFLVVFFQNCGKPPASQSSGESSGVTSVDQKFNKYQVAGLNTVAVWDDSKQRFLDVDLSNGSVQAYEQAGRVAGATYQLSNEQLVSLKGILQQAEVCEPVEKSAQQKDIACTMVYVYPYATLVSQNQQTKLGEQTSGCDVPVDLCDDKSNQLKDWSKSLVDSL